MTTDPTRPYLEHAPRCQRAMASALVLADDGRREGGRWDYRSQMLPGQQSESSTWRVSMMRAGVILDFCPELAADVIAGTLPLKSAFQQADEARRREDAAGGRFARAAIHSGVNIDRPAGPPAALLDGDGRCRVHHDEPVVGACWTCDQLAVVTVRQA